MVALSDILKMKLETLLGERGPSANAAVRRGELDALMSKAAIASMSKAGTSVNAQVAEALRIAKRAEAAVAALQASQTSAESETADDTAQNERLSQVLSSLFTWNGGTYSLRIPAQGINGTILGEQIADEAISIAKFATNLRPVEIVSSLPTTDNFDGRHVYRTTDKSLWRFNGTAWINTNAADQIVGKLVAGQIEVGAVGAAEIAADAIVARHLVVADYSNMVLDSELADPTSWTTDLTAQIATSTAYNMRANRAVRISGTYTAPAGSTHVGWWAATKAVPVEGGRHYALSCVIDPNGGSTGTITVNVQWLDPTGAVLSIGFVTGDATNAARQEVSAILTAPATAIAARLYIRRGTTTAGGTCTGVIIVGNLSLRRAASADLIVDGSITGNHLTTASAVITDTAQIANLIVDTIHVKDGAITLWRKALPADKSSGWVAASWNTIGSLTFTPKATDMVAFVGLTINRGYTGTLPLRLRWRGVGVGGFVQSFDETYGRLVEFRHFSSGGLASGTLDLQILRYEGTASLAVSDINIVVAEFMK